MKYIPTVTVGMNEDRASYTMGKATAVTVMLLFKTQYAMRIRNPVCKAYRYMCVNVCSIILRKSNQSNRLDLAQYIQ